VRRFAGEKSSRRLSSQLRHSLRGSETTLINIVMKIADEISFFIAFKPPPSKEWLWHKSCLTGNIASV
jgi:hypothetical protein